MADEETGDLTADMMGPVVLSELEFESRKHPSLADTLLSSTSFLKTKQTSVSTADTWKESEVTCAVKQGANDSIL